MLVAGLTLVPHVALATGIREIVREPAPLVLKDGRIAHVRVYAVPFKEGAGELDAGVRAELTGLIETIATDCFLTAQAIGHVEPAAAKGGESLTAHRLARTRADRVQAAMVARGFSASSIASVWDWQFLVGEPRVTLWVFRLNEGEDCKGEVMAKPDGKQVAAMPEKDLPARGQPVKPAPEAPAKPPVATETAAKPAPQAAPARPAVTEAAPTEGAESAPAPAPASRPSAAQPAGQTKVVAADPPPSLSAIEAEAAKAPAGQVTPVRAQAKDDGAEIVFDVNSSFFSKDARNSLKQFVASLPRGQPVAVDVVVAVGGADVRESPNTDPLRYNRWMAERRGSRVVEFLKENAGGRKLDFNPAYQENDSSRSVVLKLRALR